MVLLPISSQSKNVGWLPVIQRLTWYPVGCTPPVGLVQESMTYILVVARVSVFLVPIPLEKPLAPIPSEEPLVSIPPEVPPPSVLDEPWSVAVSPVGVPGVVVAVLVAVVAWSWRCSWLVACSWPCW